MLAWHTDARSLERLGVPREFTTKSRVVIVSNDWNAQQDGGAPGSGARGAVPAECGRRPRQAGSGSRTGRSTSGLPQTYTGSVSRRSAITCGRRN